MSVTDQPEPMKVFRQARNQPEMDKPHTLAASYYSLQDGLKSLLTLNNKGTKPLEVKPTLFNLIGDRLDVPTVTVNANSFRVIELSEWVVDAGPMFRQGSLQLFYIGHDLLLGAQVKLIDTAKSLIFDEQLVEPKAMFSSSRLEAVCWLPSKHCKADLVLSNTSDAPLSASVIVDGTVPRQQEPIELLLQPHETHVTDVRQLLLANTGGALLEAGAISITHSGPKGALLARGLIQETSTGYSSSVLFSDPLNAKSPSLQGAGLRLGKVADEPDLSQLTKVASTSLRLGKVADEPLTPVVVARNISNTETALKGRIPYTTSNGSMGLILIGETLLRPRETRVLKLVAAADRFRRDEIVSAGLEFEYNTEPGSVVISALSATESGNQVFHVPMLDPLAQRSSTGGYPWSKDGDTSTIVYIKNVTELPQQYVIQLNYAGGQYILGMKTIEARQTAAIDFGVLRDKQLPDEQGHTIPLDVKNGQVVWSLVRGEAPDDLVLIGRAEQVDLVKAISSSYACQSCCNHGFYSAEVSPFNVRVDADGVYHFDAYQTDIDCYSNLYRYIRSIGVTWSSNNTQVATVNSSGTATARSGGQVTITASWSVVEYRDPIQPCGPPSRPEQPNVPDPCACSSLAFNVRPTAQFIVNPPQLVAVFTPLVSGDPDSTISGQPFNLQIEARVAGSNPPRVPANFNAQVRVAFPSPQLISGESISQNPVQMSGGIGQTQIVLRVVDNVPSASNSRSYTLNDTRGSSYATPGAGLVKVWFNVIATREGLVSGTTGCGHTIVPNDHFVALPATGVCNTGIMLRNGTLSATTSVLEVGPWFPHSSPSPGNPCVGPSDP